MRKIRTCLLLLLAMLFSHSFAGTKVEFSKYFENNTLRVDYIFSGDSKHQSIALDELCEMPGWAGRHVNLDSLPLHGMGQITMTDIKSGRVIYKTSFSTLFQEWTATDEALRTTKSFENVFLLPMPKDSAHVRIQLFNHKDEVTASLEHIVAPSDVLIRKINCKHPAPHRYLKKSPHPEAIDVAIVAEGYRPEEADLFYEHATVAVKSLFSYQPFKDMEQYFNVVAVALPSKDSGVSVPHENDWKETALSSHFDTFYSERYLTTLRLRQLHNLLAGIAYEHLIILANTDTYGGGGIYNSYTLTTARHPMFSPVVVHEFGHSFAALADEYGYDEYTPEYTPETEPWEQNITTLKDLSAKWGNQLPANVKIPTPVTSKNKKKIGLYEGGGNQTKNVYRAYQDCRMRTNTAQEFCPVCQRALKRLIQFYVTEGPAAE